MKTLAEQIESLYHIPVQPQGAAWTVTEAYTFCRTLTLSHYENFPVGSLLVPRSLRRHVHAIYAFARIADDFADEPCYEGQRLERLEDWDAQLQEAYQGRAYHPVFLALAQTVNELDLPLALFRDLLTAFKMDVTVKRYETFDDVLGYCRYSANPVGRLILCLFDHRDPQLFAYSDCICTALQLANFWQDVAIDLKKNRIYIPRADQAECGYSELELFHHVYDARFQRLMHRQVQRTWALFEEGFPLVEHVPFPLSAELRFTWLGGVTILARTRQSVYRVFDRRPQLTKMDFLRLGWRSLWPLFRVKEKRRAEFASG